MPLTRRRRPTDATGRLSPIPRRPPTRPPRPSAGAPYMPTISVDGLKVIYSNSTAAADITIFGSEDALSSTLNSDWFDVLKLSGAGTGTTIYSVDDPTNTVTNPSG